MGDALRTIAAVILGMFSIICGRLFIDILKGREP